VGSDFVVNKIDAFHAAVGRFVIEWNSLELCLDLLVLSARHPRSGRLGHQLKDKLVFLKTCANRRPDLAPHATSLGELADEICALSTQRHDYLHGAVIDFTKQTRPLVVTMGRMLQPRGKPPGSTRRAPVKVTTRLLKTAADRARQLGDRVLDLADVINQLPQSN
jgi:hypothetical protein